MGDKWKFGPLWIAAGGGMLMAHVEAREILELLTPPELRTDIRLTPLRRHDALMPDHGPHAEPRGTVSNYTHMTMASTSTGILATPVPTNLTFSFPTPRGTVE